jgi:hypothetical protein
MEFPDIRLKGVTTKQKIWDMVDSLVHPVEDGEVSPAARYIHLWTYSWIVKAAMKKIKMEAIDEIERGRDGTPWYGMEANPVYGRHQFDFSDNPKWKTVSEQIKELKKELSEIEAQQKVAYETPIDKTTGEIISDAKWKGNTEPWISLKFPPKSRK